MYHGLRTGFYMSITYITINYFDFFKEPFLEIFESLGSYLGDVFFLGLICVLSTLTNIYDSSKYSCLSNPNEIKKNLKPLDEYLSNEVDEEEDETIILKE